LFKLASIKQCTVTVDAPITGTMAINWSHWVVWLPIYEEVAALEDMVVIGCIMMIFEEG